MPEKLEYIDLSYLIQFTKGDQEKLIKYLNMYLKTAPQAIADFQYQLDEGNHENLKLKAHSIKPQAQYLGIESLKNVLIEIEMIIKEDGDYSRLQELVSEAKRISDEVEKELNEYLVL